jgi:CHASE3 domain sensor protein
MIYDLPKGRSTLKPLSFAALGAVIALVVAIEIMIFDGYHQFRTNTDEVSRSQDTVLAFEGVLSSILYAAKGRHRTGIVDRQVDRRENAGKY